MLLLRDPRVRTSPWTGAANPSPNPNLNPSPSPNPNPNLGQAQFSESDAASFGLDPNNATAKEETEVMITP